MTRSLLRTLGLTIALLAIGYALGRAQTPLLPPDFEIRVNAPGGRTTIECVRGCELAWVERGFKPNAAPKATFEYGCSGDRCSSARVGGWLKQ